MSKKRSRLLTATVVLAVILAGLLIWAGRLGEEPGDPTLQSSTPSTGSTSTPTTVPSTVPTTEPTAPSTVPTEPPIVKESTATIGAVGDMLMHEPVFRTGYDWETESYDLSSLFAYFGGHVSALDYAVANLETTLCGTENGYDYSGYPQFNCPDAIVEALKNAGFDNLLTANNHTYDTRNVGFLRTQEVISGLGLDHIGTVSSEEDDNFIVREVNGINIGMICYTYNTGTTSDGSVSLNGIPLTVEDTRLVNTFDYSYLGKFYDKLSGELAEMEMAGAEATILFIHWGEEYHLQPNDTQKSMAQSLCDLGIDVIIGGHPHVVQPVELLTNSNDETQKTVCLYSMGNSVSNQRQGHLSSISTAHTEDGVLFSVRFAKYSDGTVIVEAVELIPTWVNMHYNEGPKRYQILPLDTEIGDWQAAFHLTDGQFTKARDSYDRTMALVGEGLTQANEWYAQNQAAVEALLGVQ